LCRLRQYPGLNEAAQVEVDEALAHCQSLLRATAAYLHPAS
jgi:hypothetical protein